MRVFVTGATGFIGSATVADLLDAGHEVVGLARSDESAATLASAGAEVHRGDLSDLDGLRAAAAAADGVIHTAYIHDFSQMENAARTDLAAIEAIGAELADSDRPLIISSGTALVDPGQVATETAGRTRRPDSHPRAASEEAVTALAARGVRTAAVRLSPSVHGKGDHGFIPYVIGVAREKGVAAYIEDGSNRWPAVHRRDAARLFRLALEAAPADARLHGVADEGVPTREIAEVIGRHLDLPVVSISRDDAPGHFGWMAMFWGLDVPASSELTQELLDWHPVHQGLIADLEEGHYFEQPAEAAA